MNEGDVKFQAVAIDGPSASGKSTVARRVATALGYLYVDSGALYRGITWQALRSGVDSGDWKALEMMVDSLRIEFFVADGVVHFSIDGIEPGMALRSREINRHVSPVASAPGVRSRVVGWLQGMVGLGDLVMEGRDIGTVVFADSHHKFYLDASPEERARRRHRELVQSQNDADASEVGDSLKRRDRIDSTRKVDPLRIAEGAVVVDSTSMSIDEVVAQVVGIVRSEMGRFA